MLIFFVLIVYETVSVLDTVLMSVSIVEVASIMYDPAAVTTPGGIKIDQVLKFLVIVYATPANLTAIEPAITQVPVMVNPWAFA
jgi:hypothetical protein